MKVHLVRAKDFSPSSFQSVLQVLKPYHGPIEFVSAETDTEIKSAIEIEILDVREFEKAKELPRAEFSMLSGKKNFSSDMYREKIEFPHTAKRAKWDSFFEVCKAYRIEKNVNPNDIVLLLTDTANEYNWFGGPDASMKNAFIHTADWHHYFEGLNERFPIAFEIVAWTLRMLMLGDAARMAAHWHMEPKGCISDFCKQKNEIVLKMRTADICPKCMEVIKNSGINMLSLGQLMDAMEGIRRYFLAVMRTDFLSRPSRILIESYTHRIFFPDYGNLELNLNPKQRTIYCFFLRHLEGVRFVDLIDHSSELGHLYRRFSNQGSPEEIEESLNLLINPMDNNLNEVLSKIKKRLNETLGPRIAEKYYIKGSRGETYKIELDSGLIDYQSEL